jgi:hypothetical protein
MLWQAGYLTQIQSDVVNAANGYYANGIQTVGWTFGISAVNATPGYDTLNIIVPVVPPAQLPNATCINTTAGTGNIVAPTGVTAASYTAGSEILFINGANNQYTASTITAAAAAGANITLTFPATNANGTSNSDPLQIATTPPVGNTPDTLGTNFCQNTNDWVVLLGTTTYTVNGANQLTRQFANGGAQPIADQVIAFKVGVSQFNAANGASGAYLYGNNYTIRATRSVRVSVIGRTAPGYSAANFTNTFDGGNYKIEALSVIINPRNLSMNDCGSCN